ncbi:MAG TPA: FHA domain-containing protein [Albitalea sp.]|uniref:FHA domain-containing protein n=1 Tax=Piscinibacter sp. TaxID=1903157 RepID=UPI002ED460CE
MSLKSWVLGRVHRIDGMLGRSDLPPRAPRDTHAPTSPADSALANAEDLGPYGPLIGAVRDELEHFVASHVHLHLAIADHDRFVLTAIGVQCADSGDARPLLRRFMHEFKPEQVKRYLSREVIAGLPNAAAIDLSQFAGLVDATVADEDEPEGEYADLIESLRSSAPPPARPYQVSIVGRWREVEASAAPRGREGAPVTPLAGQRAEFEIDDGDGKRRVVLQAVVPGRRYIVGKGDGCDIRVNGSYTSRRHAEVWQEQGGWWIADAGSTNGIRVEAAGAAVQRSGPASAGAPPLLLADGARVVLSAQASGSSSDYPVLAMRPPAQAATRPTPIAAAVPAPTTPLTPILTGLVLTARVASGERTVALHGGALPIAVGRSRNQALVIDRAHDAVSGHHLDITEVDDTGAQVIVHGDNGVVVEGIKHAAGARFRWKLGETMVLGVPVKGAPECRLSRAAK